MDVTLLKRLNELWQPIYPYLAEWIRKWCPENIGKVLEIGPFSGGVITCLKKQSPQLELFCLVQQKDMVEAVENSPHLNINFILGNLNSLPFQSSFDMIIFRGAFFFLTPEMIAECYRALCPGGYALLGGGYGPLTPPEEISRLAVESKELNYRLGKVLISRKKVDIMVAEADLSSCSTIIEEGGLWILVSKE